MCKICKNPRADVVKKGFFTKKNRRKIQRFYCKNCCKSFSSQTGTDSYRLRKTHLRNRLFLEICSGVSQRRAALKLNIHHDTVARYIKRMAVTAKRVNEQTAKSERPKIVTFDEMETFEHSKCKPVSIFVAVDDLTRHIHCLDASQMPAKGLLAKISRKKYGLREDRRPESIRNNLRSLAQHSTIELLKSDESPRYPKYLNEQMPNIEHRPFKGRRGCVVGQGELKRGGFDPLFSLNHTCASIRYNVKRLARKTWCTTKSIERLQMVLDLVRCFFNQRLAGVKKPALY